MFSALKRHESLKKIQALQFDLAIIGGGITGAGIALEAVSRGLDVCLIEKGDFASGTSSKSTKLIHGGLRYLKQLEIGLVRESGTERNILHHLAPHLVVPQKMLLPLIDGGSYGELITSIGLKIYDFLADVDHDEKREMLDRNNTLKKEPLLDATSVLGGGFYTEYRTDDARLTIEVLKKAAEYGATIVNYCEMTSFEYTDSKIETLNCIDHYTGNRLSVKASNYVSATGPWVDKIRKKDVSLNQKRLHLTKGVHIVFPFEKLPVKQSIYFDVPDGRMIFAIPRGRITYVGTTDTNYSGNLDHVVTTKDDAYYLLNALNNTFPTIHLRLEDIESNWAGLRPLIHEEGKDPSELSRKDEIFISDSGLISIAGGKLTGYRKMAYRVLEKVVQMMPQNRKEDLKKSSTEEIPLVTPAFQSFKDVKAYQNTLENSLLLLGIKDSYYAWYLCATYGNNSKFIIEKLKSYPSKNIEENLIRAELWYGIHYEMTTSLSDFFARRTGRLYFDISSIDKYMNIILNDFIDYLRWDKARIVSEKEKMQILLYDALHYEE